MCDEIKVPTHEYISILSERGYRKEKMTIFRRGIERENFSPVENAREELEKKYSISQNGMNLLYVGRISADKNMDFLQEIYNCVTKYLPDAKLIIAGSGPESYESEYRKKFANNSNVHFLGRVKRCELPIVYSGSDLLVFPSETDTFGMAVLEAQACGLPVLVSDIGGPKEIVDINNTGFVAKSGTLDEWVARILSTYSMINHYPEKYLEMRAASRGHVVGGHDWQMVLMDLFGIGAEDLEIPLKYEPLNLSPLSNFKSLA